MSEAKSSMKFYILESAHDELPFNDNPWRNQHDKNFAMVVIADSSSSARLIASLSARSEGKNAWLDSKYSSCIELNLEVDGYVVLASSTKDESKR